MILLLTVW